MEFDLDRRHPPPPRRGRPGRAHESGRIQHRKRRGRSRAGGGELRAHLVQTRGAGPFRNIRVRCWVAPECRQQRRPWPSGARTRALPRPCARGRESSLELFDPVRSLGSEAGHVIRIGKRSDRGRIARGRPHRRFATAPRTRLAGADWQYLGPRHARRPTCSLRPGADPSKGECGTSPSRCERVHERGRGVLRRGTCSCRVRSLDSAH